MLNVQQEKFCCEFVSNGGNGQQAYQAVYGADSNTARVNASRLLKKPEVQDRLKELQAEANSEKILSAQELKERLSAIGRREVTETIFLPNGESVQKPVSIRDAIRAMETLARISGLYATKPDVDVKNQVVVIVDDIYAHNFKMAERIVPPFWRRKFPLMFTYHLFSISGGILRIMARLIGRKNL